MKAPEFPRDSTWLNVAKPLTLKEMRGQVVLLDFWTYCCINCMHVLPLLERLENELKDQPFHVIGVHSAKFEEEKNPKNVARAIQRHGIRHPVLVDSDHSLWDQYAVRAWPTFVLIDAEGKIVESIPGEPSYAHLLQQVHTLLERERNRGILTTRKTFGNAVVEDTGTLCFPGKVKVFPKSEYEEKDTIVISDTGHHRLLVGSIELGDDGWPNVTQLESVGSGGVGRADGTLESASFRRPQGVGKVQNHLYVCDTENYLLRLVDLESREVSTEAGTGESVGEEDPQDPLSVPLRSPWDCVCADGLVLIAMAGAHQIWVYDPLQFKIFPVIGTGGEDHQDGKFDECTLAQPSSLFRVGNAVIFADAEVSSIRVADFKESMVGTIVGKGLFEFGDRDGTLPETLLQHPLGAVVLGSHIFVADTFNNKVKRIDPEAQRSETFYGDGSTELLYEPGGIEVYGDHLILADTNNHRVVMVDGRSRQARVLVLPK